MSKEYISLMGGEMWVTDWIAITDEEIADKVVSLNKGIVKGDDGWYHAQKFDAKAHDIATDWRVAGMLMIETAEITHLGELFYNTIFNEWESLARQIIVSCLMEIEKFQLHASTVKRQFEEEPDNE